MSTLTAEPAPIADPPPSSRHQQRAPAIEVAGVTKSYADRRVVDDVSFDVAPGEIFGLLGANGAGKTTLVECLQGLRRPDAGRLRVLGTDPVTEGRRLRGQIGSQLQDSALPDRLRAGEAIALFGGPRGQEGRDMLGRWGLEHAARTSCADLSGGERQRLFIVLALLGQPQVVFLDELTQGLDPAARREVWKVIGQIRGRGTTVVLVSHFADEIEELCDRVGIMRNGRLIDTGTPRELTDRHAQATTITFTADRELDPQSLRRLPGVERVHQDRRRFIVHGAGEMVAAVCAATLSAGHHGPDDLRVQHPTLDDALVNLIGATP